MARLLISLSIAIISIGILAAFSVAYAAATDDDDNAQVGTVIRLFGPRYEFTGTGCVVGHRGGRTYILTCFHVADGALESNFGELRSEVDNPLTDLAVISIADEFGIPWIVGDTPEPGAEIECRGFFAGQKIFTSGFMANDVKCWADVTVGPGMSGSAVVGEDGRLVGLLKGTWYPLDLAIFIHSDDVKNILEEAGL